MKYVFLFTGTMDGAVDEDEAAGRAIDQRIEAWFERYGKAGKIVGGQELAGPRAATTVRFNNGMPLVTDGPYIEAKEVVGGYAELEVADLDEALEIAKTWPGRMAVEVRPVVEH